MNGMEYNFLPTVVALGEVSLGSVMSSKSIGVLSVLLESVDDPSPSASSLHAINCTIVANVSMCLMKIILTYWMLSKCSTHAQLVATMDCDCGMNSLERQ